MTEVRKAVGEAMEAANAYISNVKKNMADQAAQAQEDGNRAQFMLIVGRAGVAHRSAWLPRSGFRSASPAASAVR